MADAPRSSFIPKQAKRATQAPPRRRFVVGIFNTIAALIMVGVLVGAGGIFVYTEYLKNRVEEQQSTLAAEYEKFNESTIDRVRFVDGQLRAAAYLLDQHRSPSAVFDALEARTKVSVQYTSFTYQIDPAGDVSLAVAGITDDFESVALQWQQYFQDELLANVEVARVGLGGASEEAGVETATPGSRVAFEFTTLLSGDTLAYSPSPGASQGGGGTFNTGDTSDTADTGTLPSGDPLFDEELPVDGAPAGSSTGGAGDADADVPVEFGGGLDTFETVTPGTEPETPTIPEEEEESVF